MKGGPQAQRRRGFIMAFGAGAVAALGVAALIAGDHGGPRQLRPHLRGEPGGPRRLLQAGAEPGARQRVGRRDRPRAAKALRRPLLALPGPSPAAAVRVGDLGPFLWRRPDRHRREARAAGGDRPAAHAGPARRDQGGRSDHRGGRALARGCPRRGRHGADQGTAGNAGRAAGGLRLRRRRGTQHPTQARLGGGPGRGGRDQASGHQQGRLCPVRDLQRGGSRRAGVDDRATRPSGRAGPGARSAG